MTGIDATRGHLLEHVVVVDAGDDGVHVALERERRVLDRLARRRGRSRLSCRTTGVPPSRAMPTSKLTRVRRLGFSKINATERPASGALPVVGVRPAFSAAAVLEDLLDGLGSRSAIESRRPEERANGTHGRQDDRSCMSMQY